MGDGGADEECGRRVAPLGRQVRPDPSLAGRVARVPEPVGHDLGGRPEGPAAPIGPDAALLAAEHRDHGHRQRAAPRHPRAAVALQGSMGVGDGAFQLAAGQLPEGHAAPDQRRHGTVPAAVGRRQHLHGAAAARRGATGRIGDPAERLLVDGPGLGRGGPQERQRIGEGDLLSERDDLAQKARTDVGVDGQECPAQGGAAVRPALLAGEHPEGLPERPRQDVRARLQVRREP